MRRISRQRGIGTVGEDEQVYRDTTNVERGDQENLSDTEYKPQSMCQMSSLRPNCS